MENALTHLCIRTLGLYRLLKLHDRSVTSYLVSYPYCLVENKMFIWRVCKLYRHQFWLFNSVWYLGPFSQDLLDILIVIQLCADTYFNWSWVYFLSDLRLVVFYFKGLVAYQPFSSIFSYLNAAHLCAFEI